MIHWFERSQVYKPKRALIARASALGRAFEEVALTAEDGVRLHGWYFPAEAGARRARLALLFCHGNKGNISHRLPFVAAWLELGVNVLAFDYRGFGLSEGRPDEEGTYRDAQAAWRWLRQKGFAPEHIVVLGKSLGGGVAAELAVREPVGGLILQNTFTSITDLGSELFPWLPVRKLHRIRYDTLAKLARIEAPVLVAHSPTDNLIGFHHGERNFASARSPKLFWRLRGTHTSTLEDGREEYLQGLAKFLDEYVSPGRKQ